MEWWTWLLIGAGAGGAGVGGFWYFSAKTLPPPVVVEEKVGKEQLEVEKMLSNQDLLKVPCGDKYLAEHGEQLCREMFCYLMGRGVVGNKAETSSCEASSITINKAYIMKTCSVFEDDTKRRACIELFDRRI